VREGLDRVIRVRYDEERGASVVTQEDADDDGGAVRLPDDLALAPGGARRARGAPSASRRWPEMALRTWRTPRAAEGPFAARVEDIPS
jgi:hypothetical protein